jgi:hypothetical protein
MLVIPAILLLFSPAHPVSAKYTLEKTACHEKTTPKTERLAINIRLIIKAQYGGGLDSI